MSRASGVLLAISSLPSRYGIGCFSKEAYEFVDWLCDAGQKYWQILPMGPTSFGDSPYQSFSTFAGNPYFIDLEDLIDRGWITKAECDKADFGENPKKVEYKKIYDERFKLLRKAYENSGINDDIHFHEYLKKNDYWVYDYALFMALKSRFEQKPWHEWPEDIRKRYGYSMDYYRKECYFDVEFWLFVQYIFFEQWMKLKKYANDKGVKIIGDIPIYVAYDSADVWAGCKLFQFNEDNVPVAVAGCPPDGFSEDGQLWGNPLYNWDYHKATGYEWWISRMNYCFNIYDIVRIDHFRGFDEYYSIPYGDTSAKNGHWEKGPGIELFERIEAKLGKREIIAEDLGFVTDSVRSLVKNTGFPGMKVIEFAFDSRDSGSANDYLPHNYTTNSVVYTGTHDNETLAGWWSEISGEERRNVRRYFTDHNSSDSEIVDVLIHATMRSVSKLCVIPMQDYLGLSNEARMNKPSTLGGNWQWRVTKQQLSKELAARIKEMTQLYGRI